MRFMVILRNGLSGLTLQHHWAWSREFDSSNTVDLDVPVPMAVSVVSTFDAGVVPIIRFGQKAPSST